MNVRFTAAIKPLIEHCLKFEPLKVAGVLLLMLFSSVTSGIGILLIIPLLASIGIDVGSTSLGSSVSHTINLAANALGLTLELSSVLILYVFLITAVASFSFFNTVIIMSIRQVFVVALRKRLSRALFYTDWHYLNKQHMSDYMRVLTGQVNQAGESLISLLNLSSGLVLISAYLFFSLFVSTKLTLLAVILALVLGGLLLPLNRRISASGAVGLKASKQLQRNVFENTSSLKVIKGFSSEELYLQRLHENSQLLEQQKIQISKYNALTHWLNLACGSLIFAILFYVAIAQLEIPVADLMVMLFIFSRLMPQVSNVQKMYQNLVHKLPVLADINTALQGLEKRTEFKEASGKALDFSKDIKLVDLSYQHEPEKGVTIDHLNAVIKVNHTIAIVGPSGVGKSTLADLISGLLKPKNGDILVDDVPITESNCLEWRKHVAYVTQDVFLFHQSVRDNLSWVCDTLNFGDANLTDADLWNALDSANASDFVKKMPQGLDTLIGDRGILLSGGERQRLALARALLSKPDLLILDEATSALDYDSEIKIRDALIKLNGKLTIIIITHNETTIEHVSQRIVLGEA